MSNTEKFLVRGFLNDPRVQPGMKRTRSGPHQHFYEEVSRRKRVALYDFTIPSPQKSWYAQEIDGVWCWVDGCDKCNGVHENHCYIRCEKHDVCVSCGIGREQAAVNKNGAKWGVRGGWQCETCHESARQIRLAAAEARIRERDENEETECFFESEPHCPWCGFKMDDDGENNSAVSQIEECPDCERQFKLTAEHSVNWSTERHE
jgi:hypothetical protein